MKQVKVFLSLLILAIIVFFLTYQFNIQAVQTKSEPIIFEVKEDDSLNHVLERLEEEKIIRSSFFSKIEAKRLGLSDVYAGKFDLDKSWSAVEIMTFLSDPEFSFDYVDVTLVEGFWARDIASELADKLNHDEQEYLNLWNDRDYIKELMKDYSFLQEEILEQKDSRVLLEGYLYPDTYRLQQDYTAKEVTKIILDNAQEKFNEIEDLVMDNRLNFTVHELYTFASIVEYEAGLEPDMKRIAGVFKNRLDEGMMLQSSPTICYSLYEFNSWEECESAKNNQIDSVYNTYRYKGLPPGPILNPSIKALRSSLKFEENDYFYFIADVHHKKDGKIHYQKTYAEHELVRKELLGY